MQTLPAQDRLIVSLDLPNLRKAEELFEKIGNKPRFYKIGYEFFYGVGKRGLDLATRQGANIFLDLKLHDIPNTVSKAVEQLVSLNVKMLTLHISGGGAMMSAAREAAEKSSAQLGLERPLLLGVTVLTSMEQQDLILDGSSLDLDELVVRRALLAQSHGLDGVICSPKEAALIKKMSGGGLLTVTPGVRLSDDHGDQKRVMTPKEAMENGSDYLVVGRPIHGAADPAAAFDAIIENMKEGLA